MARRRSTFRRRRDPWTELARKPRWSAEEARSLLDAQSKSRRSLAAFARQHGLPLPRLYAWRRRLRGKGVVGAVAPRFLPVRIVSARDVAGAVPGSGLEIVLAGGRRIRLAETFDPAALVRVVEILERPTC